MGPGAADGAGGAAPATDGNVAALSPALLAQRLPAAATGDHDERVRRGAAGDFAPSLATGRR